MEKEDGAIADDDEVDGCAVAEVKAAEAEKEEGGGGATEVTVGEAAEAGVVAVAAAAATAAAATDGVTPGMAATEVLLLLLSCLDRPPSMLCTDVPSIEARVAAAPTTAAAVAVGCCYRDLALDFYLPVGGLGAAVVDTAIGCCRRPAA